MEGEEEEEVEKSISITKDLLRSACRLDFWSWSSRQLVLDQWRHPSAVTAETWTHLPSSSSSKRLIVARSASQSLSIEFLCALKEREKYPSNSSYSIDFNTVFCAYVKAASRLKRWNQVCRSAPLPEFNVKERWGRAIEPSMKICRSTRVQ